MKLLLDSNGAPATTERLAATTKSTPSAAELEIYETIAELLNRPNRKKCDQSVVIFCASTQEHSTDSVGCRHRLNDLRITLTLPDRDSSTLAQGFSLWPRFVSILDTDFSDVSAVLGKMLRIYGRKSIALQFPFDLRRAHHLQEALIQLQSAIQENLGSSHATSPRPWGGAFP